MRREALLIGFLHMSEMAVDRWAGFGYNGKWIW